jgi:hydrogenase-4 transcriptional activator
LERFQSLLLSVWREACRHIELSESAAVIACLLEERLPLELLMVRQFDFDSCALKTVAIGQSHSAPFHATPDAFASPARWQRLIAWAQRGVTLSSPANRRSGETALLVPPEVEGDVIAGPLTGSAGPIGALVLTAPFNRSFSTLDAQLLAQLLEPFSVALENHLRVHELKTLREAAVAEKHTLLKRLGQSKKADETIIGAESGLQRVMQRVDMVASSDVPVLILGETGTGKEVISRAIHTRSRRSSGPFIRVNCGAIPNELIDSQLFGHERGSFTGADATRQGWFERADGGTLFLDEIGELPLAAQVRLLRVLQDAFIERVGGQNPIRVDVRIVAATHRDLSSMVRSGQFREDLWYRINVFPLQMPPLRDRPEDIAKLVRHFTARASERFGLPYVEPSSDDFLVMLQYRWPGNIRELAAVIDRAVILGEGQRLEIGTALGVGRPTESVMPTPNDAEEQATYYEVIPESQPGTSGAPSRLLAGQQVSAEPLTLDEAMKRHIQSVLQRVSGRIEGRGGAAELLGINPHTLRARMRKLGVQWAAFRGRNGY